MPAMTKERQSLFIQFSFLFSLLTTTVAALLLALFFTRDTAGGVAADSQQQQLYAGFRNFDKLKPPTSPNSSTRSTPRPTSWLAKTAEMVRP